jgi:phospholipid/cholesterol/gamma-HCH transport system ATP-binding protein
MNSVMGIGENITFICEGRAEWQGSNQEIMDADNKPLEDFIFASDILRQAKITYDNEKHASQQR